MTSTSVKNAGFALMDLATAQMGKNAVSAGGFQQVWNNRMGKNGADSATRESAASSSGRQLQRGSSLKARENQAAQKEEPQEPKELSAEEQEEAMEVLNTAALKLMQEIADAFDMSVEDLQSVMGERNLEETDLLNASVLNTLLLNLSGAEDAYALVTDGELYETYQALMDQLNKVLQESADTLETDQGQLLQFLEEGMGKTIPTEELLNSEELLNPEELLRPEELPSDKGDVSKEQITSAADEGSVEVTNPSDAVQKEQEAQNQNGTQTKEEGNHSGERSDKGQQMNLYAQDFRTQFQPNVQQPESVILTGPWSENTQEIMDQILDYMKLQVNMDTTNLEMQLHPASLGTIQIQIASKAGAVTANFIAQNEAVKAALETQMVQLKEQFEEQGIKVEAIEVTVQTHEFERNLDEQGRGRNQQEPERKNRVRKINLNNSLAAEDLDEEDALTADMMAAGGSTVDYTV